MADRYYFRLSDPDVEAAFLALPARARNDTILRALRQYLLPGGFVDVLARLDALETAIRGQQTFSPAQTPELSTHPESPDMTSQWAAALQAWGDNE
jgi:hypothetical protein